MPARPRKVYASGLALFLILLTTLAGVAEPELKFLEAEGVVIATGLSEKDMAGTNSEVLTLHVLTEANSIAKDSPPAAGNYQRTGDGLRFKPLFGFEAGIRYRAELILDDQTIAPLDFGIAQREREPSTIVTNIYPSGDVLPENQLRFYLYFSAPMSLKFAAKHVKLFTRDGSQAVRPFLELDEELWSPDGKRLTLFFDPGRVKRGLKPHEDDGPVLIAGQTYTLVVESGFEDADGLPLASEFRKTFRAAPVDYSQPDPSRWKITAPDEGTNSTVRVEFEAPLDHGMLQRMIEVISPDGTTIPGAIEVHDNETAWNFKPAQPWQKGRFKLRIDRLLEDSCGNSIERHFEMARAERTLPFPEQRFTEREFEVGSASPAAAVLNWGEWRGPNRNGISDETNLPVAWSPGELLVWHAETAGPGASTPIIWNDRVFITAQSGRDAKVSRPGVVLSRADDELEFHVQCFGRSDGKLLWEHNIKPQGTLTPTHSLHNQCTPSCVTDGKRVIAWFATGQLFCYDMNGAEMWSRNLSTDYGEFEMLWAHASSPTLFEGNVYVLCDHAPQANLIALRADDGKEVWKASRGKGLRSYSTPLIHQQDGHPPQIIVNSNPGIDSYDALSGRHLWTYEEFCKVPVPVPSIIDGTLIASRGYTNGPLMALPLPALNQDSELVRLTERDTSWRMPSRAPYVSSPLVYNGRVYLSSEDGQVRCLDQSTGEMLWSRKLGKTFWASPVGGDGKVYLLDEAGEMIVLADGPELSILARNSVPAPEGERMLGSPSISHGCLFYRSESRLFCVGTRTAD
ncbi:MAG: PQQ-binding-like beta-propeller repeat protein [Verrucomicrobiales bacterium]